MHRQLSTKFMKSIPILTTARPLSERPKWQSIAQSLPANSCLLVSSVDNRAQTQVMIQAALELRRKGMLVCVMAIR